MIDILSGIITPYEEGDLIISAFALQSVGSQYALNTKSAKLTWDDLYSLYQPKKAIIGERIVESGVAGSSIRFNGQDTRIQLQDSFGIGTKDFEFDFYFNPLEDSGRKQKIFDFGDGQLYASINQNKDLEIALNGTTKIMSFNGFNQWNHLAITRSNGEVKIFLNGAIQSTFFKDSNLTDTLSGLFIGRDRRDQYAYYFNGLIDHFRISVDTPRWTQDFTPDQDGYDVDQDTSFLLTSDADTGTYADAVQERQFVTTGSIQVDTNSFAVSSLNYEIQKYVQTYPAGINPQDLSAEEEQLLIDNPYYFDNSKVAVIGEREVAVGIPGSSLAFNGVDTRIQLQDPFNIGTKDFEFDFHFNPLEDSGRSQKIFDFGGGALYASINQNKDLEIAFNGTTKIIAFNGFNQWNHLAISRSNGDVKIFLNGVLKSSFFKDSSLADSSTGLFIGRDRRDQYAYYFNGLIDHFRISVDTARWTQEFTPDTSGYQVDSNTKFLLTADTTTSSFKDLVQERTFVTTGNILVDEDSYAVSSLTYETQKYIEKYPVGVDPATLSEEEIQDLIDNPYKYAPRTIVHIDENHYVVVTGMTEDSITYIDMGIGKDKQNESLTIAKEHFLKLWKGYAILHEDEAVQSIVGIDNKYLTVEESKGVRGAFFGSALGIAALVASVIFTGGSSLAFLPGLLTIGSAVASFIEGDWLSGILSLATFGLANGFGEFISNAVNGFASALGGFGQLLGSVFNGVTSVLKGITGFVEGVFNGIGIAGKAAANLA
ncbi:MAG: hypothetical protein KC649_05110, partial [Candidatus Omnitrophica bacterium]|nr:hypothetical protein [Candidatus Omnitrophota bacterium]